MELLSSQIGEKFSASLNLINDAAVGDVAAIKANDISLQFNR